MTAQIASTPAASPQSMAARGIAIYLWAHYRRSASVMAAAWLVAVVLDHFLFAGQIPSIGAAYHFSRILTVIVIPAIVIVMPMMATSQIMTDLWTLPIRTKTLINLLMLYGAGGAVLGWIANVLLIWRPVGLDMPVLWPVAMLIALQASSLAVRYRPTLPTHIVNTFLMLIWVFLMMTPKIREPFSDVELAAGFLVLGGWMYITTLDGAAKTRRGETWAIFPKRERRVHQRPIAPFASSVRAQAWMERRNYLPMLAVMIAGNSLLSLMMSFAAPFTGEIWPITLLTHFSHHIYARSGFSTGPFTPLVSLPFFSLLLLTVMTMIRARNKSTPPFSPVLPIDSSTWVAAKLRVFAEGTRVIWATQILLWLIWATVPAWMDGKPIPVGIALWNSLKPQMDAHDAFALAALLIGLAFLTWKVQTDHLFLIATFRSPLLCVAGALVVCAAYLTVCAAAYPISIEGIHAFAFKVPHWSPISPQRKMLADNILVIGTPVKLALTAYLLTVLRRRGHLSASNLRRTLALWSTIALLFIVLFGFALSPYQIAWYQSALGVLFFMPGVRLSLAPLALAWDRSR